MAEIKWTPADPLGVDEEARSGWADELLKSPEALESRRVARTGVGRSMVIAIATGNGTATMFDVEVLRIAHDVPLYESHDVLWAMSMLQRDRSVRRRGWAQRQRYVWMRNRVMRVEGEGELPWAPTHADMTATDWVIYTAPERVS